MLFSPFAVSLYSTSQVEVNLCGIATSEFRAIEKIILNKSRSLCAREVPFESVSVIFLFKPALPMHYNSA